MRRTSLDPEIFARAVDYRQLLMMILSDGDLKPRRGSISALSRKAGLSRSFLTEVLGKKKRLTERSASQISDALRLKSNFRSLFELLVAIEMESGRSSSTESSESDLHQKIEKMRLKILGKSRTERFKKRLQPNALSLDFFTVYAALGSIELGSTIDEILLRTQLSRSAIDRVLESMINEEWVVRRSDRYFALERAIDLDELGKNEGFINAFAQSSGELSKGARKYANDPSSFVFFTAFSIDQKTLPAMQKRLQAAILEVVDEFQDDNGSIVKRVTLGMY